jgi:hypothetical protein
MRTIKFTGLAGTTVAETSTDAVQNIDTGVTGIAFKNSDGDLISSLFITCSANDLRYSFTANPAAAGLGHVLVKGSEGIWIYGAANIRAFRFISSGAAAHAVLAMTPFYGDESALVQLLMQFWL